MSDPHARLAELLATDRYPAAVARTALGLAGAAKRRAGLDPELVEAVIALIDWPVIAQNNTDALAKALPASHLLPHLLPRNSHVAGRERIQCMTCRKVDGSTAAKVSSKSFTSARCARARAR